MISKIRVKFSGRILIVDDYSANLELLKLMLELMECKVFEAQSGKEALGLTSNNIFDLILMDIQMPEMDGVEAAKALREYSSAPIIAVTAHAITGDREKYLKLGFSDYLSKPITGESLEQLLSKFLKRVDS